MEKRLFSKVRNRWLARNQAKDRPSSPFYQSKSIGLVYHDPTNELSKDIEALKKELEKEGRVLQLLRFRRNDKADEGDFIKKDIGLWGELKGAPLAFAQKDLDFLLACHTDDIPAIDTLLLESKARCRIGGKRKEKFAGLEMQVSTPSKNLPDLLREMVRYMRKVG